jgi:hypothetical protein
MIEAKRLLYFTPVARMDKHDRALMAPKLIAKERAIVARFNPVEIFEARAARLRNPLVIIENAQGTREQVEKSQLRQFGIPALC